MKFIRIIVFIAAAIFQFEVNVLHASPAKLEETSETEFLLSKNDSLLKFDETISVDFPDEDVRAIISNVANLYGLNVIIPDELVGKITLTLRNVTWREIFEVVLEPINFSYYE